MTESKHENSFETIPDGEADQIEEIAALMVKLLDKRYSSAPPILRGVHPKSHGCVNATFEVLADIDEAHQVGLFSKPGTIYDAVIRYSNADTLVRHDLRDGQNGSRGTAIKIQNVPGEVLFEDDGGSSQDFLMINTPQFAFANVADYLKLQQILLQFDDKPEPFFAPLQNPVPTEPDKLAEFLRVKRSFDVVSLIKTKAVANPLEVPYFGAAPFQFGKDKVMRVSVVPSGPQKEQVVPDDVGENYLREAFEKTMSGPDDLVFDFRIQVRELGEENLHIEDATQFWPEDSFPPQKVAKITIPAPQKTLQECEQRLFTPWHCLAEHQPVGGINRLRKAVYFASATHRRSASAD